MNKPALFRRIWLAPHCADCFERIGEVLWCRDDVFDPCTECGAKSVVYETRRRTVHLPRDGLLWAIRQFATKGLCWAMVKRRNCAP